MSTKIIFPQVPFVDPHGPMGISEAWYKWLLSPTFVTINGTMGNANASVQIDMSQVITGSINPNIGTFGGTNMIPVITANSKGLITGIVSRSAALTSAAIAGTNTNDGAAVGILGEYKSSTIASGSAVALTTTVTANVTSISLTAGDWMVSGIVDYKPSGTTSITQFSQGSSTISATLGAQDTYSRKLQAAFVPGAVDFSEVIPPTRLSIASSTTIYLVANAAFTVAALGAYGTISARRVR